MTTDWNNRLELSVSVSSVARKRQRRSRFIADDVNHLFLLCTSINVVIYSRLQGSCISCWPPQKRCLQVIKLLSFFSLQRSTYTRRFEADLSALCNCSEGHSDIASPAWSSMTRSQAVARIADRTVSQHL